MTPNDKLKTLVFEALGAASMCWNPPPGHQVFESEKAQKIGDDLIAAITALSQDAAIQQEPIGWVDSDTVKMIQERGTMYGITIHDHGAFGTTQPIYAHPQPATQQAVFEGWVKSIISTENHEYALSRDKSGTYACPGTQIRWHAWQAAIAHAHPQPATQPQPDKAELTDDEVCEWILKQWEMFYGLRANPKMPPDIDYEFISAVIAADRALLNTGEAK